MSSECSLSPPLAEREPTPPLRNFSKESCLSCSSSAWGRNLSDYEHAATLGAPSPYTRGGEGRSGAEFFHVARRLRARIPEGVRRSNFLNRGWHTPDPSGSDRSPSLKLDPFQRQLSDSSPTQGWVTPRRLSHRVQETNDGQDPEPTCTRGEVTDEFLLTALEAEVQLAADDTHSKASYPTASSVNLELPENTLIIVDWDDTLFPTSWMGRQYGAFEVWVQGALDGEAFLDQMEPADVETLHELDCCARALVIAASELGRVACVTLAQRPWVDRCLRDFMPGLGRVWQELGITVSYAREKDGTTRVTTFTDMTPGPRRAVSTRLTDVRGGEAPREEAAEVQQILVQGELCSQKRRSMLRVIRKFYRDQCWKNVVSIGDGAAERAALQDIGLQHTNPVDPKTGSPYSFRVKTVKMVEGPEIHSLVAEHQVLQGWLPPMVAYHNDFDVKLDGDEELLFEQQQQLYEGS